MQDRSLMPAMPELPVPPRVAHPIPAKGFEMGAATKDSLIRGQGVPRSVQSHE